MAALPGPGPLADGVIDVGSPADIQVDGIEVRRVEVPLIGPLVAAHDTQHVRQSILVGVTDGLGRTGWGECVALARPTYTSEWIDGAWEVLTAFLVPSWLGRGDAGVVGHPMAAAALECALVDLSLRAAGDNLGRAVGATDRVESRAVVGLHADPDALVAEVSSRLASGHRSVKLKILPAMVDVHVSAVRRTWPELDLAVDANGSFDLDEHGAELRSLDRCALTYVEQPLSPTDILGHARLRAAWTTPIALDESITGVDDLRTAHALGAVDLVNIKPARLGGIMATSGMLNVMDEVGIAGFCGGMYELGVARAAALAVAGSPLLCGRPTDLGPSGAYVERDLTPPHVLEDDGTIAVPSGAGIGRQPDGAFVDEVTRDVVELRR